MSHIGKQVSSVTLYQEKRTLLFTQIADSLLFLTRISQISRKVAALKEVLAACRQCRVFAFRMERSTSALTLTSNNNPQQTWNMINSAPTAKPSWRNYTAQEPHVPQPYDYSTSTCMPLTACSMRCSAQATRVAHATSPAIR